ncbi:MAG: ribonuclease HII [Firmicutes bacterium]|nr:ribonuclease HII [Bacillota bacterium]
MTELLYTLENGCRAKGYVFVAGTDEAGRGCLAGPVVAAACILPEGASIPGLNDSKKLSAKRREALYDVIINAAVSYGIAEASAEEIDSINILNAALLAMKRAVDKLSPTPDIVLVDGNKSPDFGIIPSMTVVHGDGISPSIAASSILAKVYRDRLLVSLDAEYPGYGFAKNKSYCTKEHVEALLRLGPAPCHRKTFLSFLEEKNERAE